MRHKESSSNLSSYVSKPRSIYARRRTRKSQGPVLTVNSTTYRAASSAHRLLARLAKHVVLLRHRLRHTQVGFNYAPLVEMIERYPPSEMREGFNDNGEETVFYVSNPALGLWAVRERLMAEEGEDEGEGGGRASTGGEDGARGGRPKEGGEADGDGVKVSPA